MVRQWYRKSIGSTPRASRSSSVYSFFSDLDILRPSTVRCAACTQREANRPPGVFVMGKPKVFASHVDIELRPQVLPRHRHALDVPSGPADAPRALPAELPPGLRRKPQREVLRAPLAAVDRPVRAAGRLPLPQDRAGQLPVSHGLRHVEIEVPAFSVRGSLPLQLLSQRDHLGDMGRRARVDVGGKKVHPAAIPEKRPGEELRDLPRRLPRGPGGGDHLVLRPLKRLLVHMPHVGDVLDGERRVAGEPDGPEEQVGQHVGPQVPDVDVAVHGGAARIYPDTPRPEGIKRNLLPGNGVVEGKHWGPYISWLTSRSISSCRSFTCFSSSSARKRNISRIDSSVAVFANSE